MVGATCVFRREISSTFASFLAGNNRSLAYRCWREMSGSQHLSPGSKYLLPARHGLAANELQ